MFDSSPDLVGLDIGTSKICAVVGDITESGALGIIGLGQAKSRGVRKGEIIGFDQTVEDIRNAIVEAEQSADIEIRSVFLGVSGSHIRGFNNRGFHPVASHEREIMQDDLDDAVKNARAINIPAENRVIHVMRQPFLVDGQEGIANPVGMYGARVEVDVHVIHGNLNRLQTSIRAVNALQLEVEELFFNGVASAVALLNTQQKELGSLVIDMGGGVTEYVVYARGVIKHSGVLAIGGDHVTNDLACGLKVPLGRAEQLKIDQGSALCSEKVRGQTISLPNEFALEERRLSVESLRRIMSLRLEETFDLIAQDLDQAGMLDQIREGVFLCGGGCRIPDIQKLASRVFGLPAFIGKTNSISGLKSALDQPEFATAIGLVRCGSFDIKKRSNPNNGLASGLKTKITQLLGLGT